MRNTRWIYKSNEFNIESELDTNIAQILYNREIRSEKEIDIFINGTLENLVNPSEFSDVDRAVERLLEAKEKNQNVWIYGDYDVDGITSTSLCFLALKEVGIDVNYYIPLRDEGYGLNKEALKHIKDAGGDLIITVDCGVSSIAEVEYANSLGMEIIITDHHEINNTLPPAYAVINPKREENRSDYRYFAGVGTAFMLLLALYKKLNKKNDIYKYLDIVAIGTIADIVPLKGENRILVKEGLKQLKNSKLLGISMLMKALYEDIETKKFDTYDVGFIIAPIFNAAGRLEDAKMAVQLFISDSHVECTNLIFNLIGKNSERKIIQEKILQRAFEKIEVEKLEESSVLVVAEENFHHGVIGIVASKILDRFYKPTIVMEIKSDGIAVASCRSTEGFNMIEALNSMKDIFIKYGGHAGAAGFSIQKEKIAEFSKQINEYAKSVLNEQDKKKPVKIDCELSLSKISYDLMDKLALLEPYGFGNPSPLFSIENCGYSNFRAIGKDKNHLMLNLVKDGVEIKNCVWFNSDDMMNEILENKELDIAFKLKMETYKDRYQYKIFIDDVKFSKEEKNNFKEYKALYEIKFPIKTVFYTRQDIENKKINLGFVKDDILVNMGSSNIGFLDNQTKIMLKKLKEYYGYSFNIEIEKIEKKEENYNVFSIITKNEKFETISLDSKKIFNEIKRFLIKDLEYNSIQKKVLKTIFIDKKRVILNIGEGRGLKTILKTIELYFNSLNKKILILKEGEEVKPGYDFYIYLGDKVKDEKVKFDLIVTKEKLSMDEYINIEDSYSIPENVKIVDENELVNHRLIYSKKLPNSEKINIIEKIKSKNKIYATEDVKIIF